MSQFKTKRGFTLIELLVVVAIIGILASVMLANLNNARTKGLDAAIKGSLSGARAQAALFYDNNQNYDTVCTAIDGIGPMVINAATRLNALAVVGDNTQPFIYDDTGLGGGAAVCHDSVDAWAAIVSLKLPSLALAGWCVDSTGASKEADSLLSGVYACP